MSDAAHDIPGQTAEFAYKLIQPFSLDSGTDSFPCSGKYQGWFNLQVLGKVSKVDENNLMLKFSPTENADHHDIVGDGSNKFGKFTVRGHALVSTGYMKLYKEYVYNSVPVNNKKRSLGGSPSSITKQQKLGTPGNTSKSPGLSIAAGGSSSGSAVTTPRESSGRVKKPSSHLLAADFGYTVSAEKKTPKAATPKAGIADLASSSSCKGTSRVQRTSQVIVKCLDILKELIKHPAGIWFLEPVDPVALNLPDYFTIVTKPMDLNTVKRNIESGSITTPEEFVENVRLIFRNALAYNVLKENPVNVAARALSQKFEDRFRHMMSHYQANMETEPVVVPKVASKKVTTKQRASTGSAPMRSASASAALPMAPTPRMGGPTAYKAPAGHDETSHVILEMQRQIATIQEEILKLRSAVMKQEVQNELDEKRDAAQNPLSFEEKKQLIDCIGQLPALKMRQVVEIIQSSMASDKLPDGEEMEIALDDLDTLTLRKLQKFVEKDTADRRKHMLAPAPVHLSSAPAAKKARREVGTKATGPKRSAGVPQTYFAPDSFEAVSSSSNNAGDGYNVGSGWDGDVSTGLDLDLNESVLPTPSGDSHMDVDQTVHITAEIAPSTSVAGSMWGGNDNDGEADGGYGHHSQEEFGVLDTDNL